MIYSDQILHTVDLVKEAKVFATFFILQFFIVQVYEEANVFAFIYMHVFSMAWYMKKQPCLFLFTFLTVLYMKKQICFLFTDFHCSRI